MKLAKLLVPALLSGFIAFPAFAADEQQNAQPAQNTVAASEQQSANAQENLATSNDPLHTEKAEKAEKAKHMKHKKHKRTSKKQHKKPPEAEGQAQQQSAAEQQPNQNS
jgi:hypothetical protein